MNTYTIGFLITLLGVLVITPDSLLIRLVDADVWAQAFWRGILSSLAIMAVFLAHTGRNFVKRIKGMGIPGIWISVIFGFGTLCFLFSITHTSVANMLFINSTSPVFAALFARFFLGEAVTPRIILTIIGALIGIAVIASGSFNKGAGVQLGDLAALGSAISLAATFSIARAAKSVSMVPAAGISGILSGLVAFYLAPSVSILPEDWIWVALVGLVVAPLGFALLTTGPRYLPAPDVSLLLLLEAVLAPLLVWWVLAENPGNQTLIGGAIVLAVMVISNLAVLKRSRV
jgi:drug/metabolite transporter (DMT)-like permease